MNEHSTSWSSNLISSHLLHYWCTLSKPQLKAMEEEWLKRSQQIIQLSSRENNICWRLHFTLSRMRSFVMLTTNIYCHLVLNINCKNSKIKLKLASAPGLQQSVWLDLDFQVTIALRWPSKLQFSWPLSNDHHSRLFLLVQFPIPVSFELHFFLSFPIFHCFFHRHIFYGLRLQFISKYECDLCVHLPFKGSRWCSYTLDVQFRVY